MKPIVFGRAAEKCPFRLARKMFRELQDLDLAIQMIYQDLEMKTALMRELKSYFIEGISKIENTTVHGLTDENSAPHIISVGFAVSAVKCFCILGKQ